MSETTRLGGRHLITTTQLMMINELLKHKDKKEITKIIKEVENKQFIGNSTKPVRLDANKITIKYRLIELLIIIQENYPQHQTKSKGSCRCEACQAQWLLTREE